MLKRLFVVILISGSIFLAGILVGHFKPSFFHSTYLILKELVFNEDIDTYQNSVTRLNDRFEQTSCQKEDEGYSFFVAGHSYGTPGTKYDGLYKPFKNY